MRKPYLLVPLMGMGWILSLVPSVLRLVVYLIPIIVLCLIVAIVKVWISVIGSKAG